MKKKTITGLLLMILISVFAIGFCDEAITITVNGKSIQMDQPPVVVNGRTMVPLRAIFESFGITPEWDGKTQTVTATSGRIILILEVGNGSAIVNGQSVKLDAAASLYNGRTMVPARFVAESLGAKVDWDSESRTVEIIKTLNEAQPSLVPVEDSILPVFPKPDAPTRPKGVDSTDSTLTLEYNPLLEFSIDLGVTWQSSPTFTNLTPLTDYGIISRVKATATSPASDPSVGTEMTTGSRSYLAKWKSCSDTTITLEDNPTLEYSVDGGVEWQAGPVINGLKPNTKYTVLTRYKGMPATASKWGIEVTTYSLPLQPISQIPGPSRPRGIETTSTSITLESNPSLEYSSDLGATWQDSPVFSGLEPATTYEFVSRYRATQTAPASKRCDGTTDITTGAAKMNP